MGCGEQRQYAAGIGQSGFGRRGAAAEGGAQIAAPLVRIGLGVVEQAAPDAVGVLVLPPVAALRIQGSIGVAAAAPRTARALTSFKKEGLTELHAGGSAEVGGMAVGRGRCRVAPQQHTLRAGPDAEEDAVLVPLLVQVAVAVAQE